jgi:hypothetical protein
MKLEITEQQLNLIEQQQLNEIAWIKSVSSHISQLDKMVVFLQVKLVMVMRLKRGRGKIIMVQLKSH